MSSESSKISRAIIGNPVYVLSAAVMMYGIALLLDRPGRTPGDVTGILSIYAVLQLYEAALIGLAAWILLRLLVREDGITLLLLECLFLGAAFIALDELLAASTALGLGIASLGLGLAAVKLGLARRRMGVPLDRGVRIRTLVLLALPLSVAVWMKSAVDEPLPAAWTAYASWLLLAGVLAIFMASAVLRHLERRTAAPLILQSVTLLCAGAHLFSLHHAFYAPAEVWYPAPVLMVLGAIAAGAVQRARWTGLRFVALWLPFSPLLLFFLDRSVHRAPWGDLPPLTQPLHLTQWWLLVVYIALLLTSRRVAFVLPALVAFALAAEARRETAVEFALAYRGWCLVGLAFILLMLGAWLTLDKHRRKLAEARSQSYSATVAATA